MILCATAAVLRLLALTDVSLPPSPAQHGKRQDATIIYNSTLPVLFGVKKYADALWQVRGRWMALFNIFLFKLLSVIITSYDYSIDLCFLL